SATYGMTCHFFIIGNSAFSELGRPRIWVTQFGISVTLNFRGKGIVVWCSLEGGRACEGIKEHSVGERRAYGAKGRKWKLACKCWLTGCICYFYIHVF